MSMSMSTTITSLSQKDTSFAAVYLQTNCFKVQYNGDTFYIDLNPKYGLPYDHKVHRDAFKSFIEEFEKLSLKFSSEHICEFKHIVRKDKTQWINYGSESVWENGCEAAINTASKQMQDKRLTARNLVDFLMLVRGTIELVRDNPCALLFGRIRLGYARTSIKATNPAYGFGLKRALKLKFDGKYYKNELSLIGADFVSEKGRFNKNISFGLVKYRINGEYVGLSQYLFCTRVRRYEIEEVFGYNDDDYILSASGEKKSGLIYHSDHQVIAYVMEHIYELIDLAIYGDLRQLPKIHWLFVHLAPTPRGSGGIAEMIIKTICKYHGIELPRWKEDISPSMEILLEPNETKFSKNYYKLFEDGKTMKHYFEAHSYQIDTNRNYHANIARKYICCF